MNQQDRVPEYILEDSQKMYQPLHITGFSNRDFEQVEVALEELSKVLTMLADISGRTQGLVEVLRQDLESL